MLNKPTCSSHVADHGRDGLPSSTRRYIDLNTPMPLITHWDADYNEEQDCRDHHSHHLHESQHKQFTNHKASRPRKFLVFHRFARQDSGLGKKLLPNRDHTADNDVFGPPVKKSFFNEDGNDVSHKEKQEEEEEGSVPMRETESEPYCSDSADDEEEEMEESSDEDSVVESEDEGSAGFDVCQMNYHDSGFRKRLLFHQAIKCRPAKKIDFDFSLRMPLITDWEPDYCEDDDSDELSY